MQQIVIKFGGTSVSSRENWNNIVKITRQHIKNGYQPVIVCSALATITNKLIQAIAATQLELHEGIYQEIRDSYYKLAKALEVSEELLQTDLNQLHQLLTGIALLKTAPPKSQAQIMSFGELMITRLGQAFLQKMDINCHWLNVKEALVSTPVSGGNGVNYLAARCDSPPNPELSKKLLKTGAEAIITQGFFATNAQGDTVLLGRGGSDTSAALLAAILQASLCEIWTDVPGIYTANPHQLPHARLLKQLNYDEAQEIASMGAKVLHPYCLAPVRRAGIPMIVKFISMPEHTGTRISTESDEKAPPIKAIEVKHGIILVSIDTLNMWQQGYSLADIFAVIKEFDFSADLLSSSEFNLTISLDNNSKLHDRRILEAMLVNLNRFGKAKLIEPCSAVSLVGTNIHSVLPHLGSALEVFDSQHIYLMSLASNDLNLTLVVDESQAESICKKLHHLLIENNPHSFYHSKSWHEEFGQQTVREPAWWELEREQLLRLAQTHSPCYVYHRPTMQARANEILAMKSVDQFFYAMKANPHPEILQTFYCNNELGFECVSIHELQHIIKLFPKIDPQRILFTPNFVARSEYELAFKTGCYITVDSLYPLQNWPELFKNQNIILRIDPGTGKGHHKFVATAGMESKFGIPQSDIAKALELIEVNKIKVIGLHSHSGSGILTTELWKTTAIMLTDLLIHFPDVRIINLGGGLGIAEKPGQQGLNVNHLDALVMDIKSQFNHLSFWLEPGRFLVANSGVILANVTQCKDKGTVRFIGIETGMNSLMRPSLYGAYHEIVNLTRLHEEKIGFVHIVGPICESGDTLGYNRPFPMTLEKDVILIANAGAYGHCMSSNYNLRPAAQEVIIG